MKYVNKCQKVVRKQNQSIFFFCVLIFSASHFRYWLVNPTTFHCLFVPGSLLCLIFLFKQMFYFTSNWVTLLFLVMIKIFLGKWFYFKGQAAVSSVLRKTYLLQSITNQAQLLATNNSDLLCCKLLMILVNTECKCKWTCPNINTDRLPPE